MLKRNPDFPIDGFEAVEPGSDARWFMGAVAVIWLALFVGSLTIGAFLAGWQAVPLAFLFASMATARIMESMAA